MKISRGGVQTDTKSPEDYDGYWEPGHAIFLNGTKDKSGERHTHLLLRIEEDDVIAFFMAFLKTNPQRLFELLADDLTKRDQEIDKLRQENKELKRQQRRQSQGRK